MKTLFSIKPGAEPRAESILNRARRILIAGVLVICGLVQAPVANAQASAAAPLINMGAQLAMQLVPMLIPVVIGGAVMGVRGAAMLPSLVKERCSDLSLPHLPGRGRKKLAHRSPDSETPSDEADAQPKLEADAEVSGTVIKGEGEEQKINSAEETEGAQAGAQVQVDEGGEQASMEEVAPPAKPARPKDNSEWYMD